MATLYFVPDDKDAWAAARYVQEQDSPKGKVYALEKITNGDRVRTAR